MAKENKRQKKDKEIKDHKKRERERAIQLVEAFSQKELKNYNEPSRAGISKGDPIGFSRKKHHAAHLMVLHPHCLKLKEIAEITNISEGVLRVWRTDNNFIQAIREFGKSLTELITDLIEGNVELIKIYLLKEAGAKISIPDDKKINGAEKVLKEWNLSDPVDVIMIFLGVLPFFNSSVAEHFAEWMKKSIDSSNTGSYDALIYPMIAEYVLREASVYDVESLRKWETNPNILKITKLLIETDIDILMGLAARGEDYWEDTKKFADSLKKFIIDKMEFFAH